ncbi:MAG TPA: ABC transporter permease [Candidatus Acidoferrum sp.]|jgi:ABC-2 type transport system permease protein|nr:ABC transporter permease [Candidatus Acidoferrum sp.]
MSRSSQFALALRKLALLFRRDFAVARSYRAAFVIELFQALFGCAGFYFLSRFVESPKLQKSLPPGANYFSFALVGIAFFDYLSIALSTFDASLQEARQNGTLENLLVTQTSLPVILAGSSLYPFALMSLRTTIYIGWGAVLFGFPLRGANWLGALLVLGASVLAFSGLGILSASYLLIFKRGNPVNWAILGLSSVLGGMLYPISVLPVWLQHVARLIPVTYSLEGMRAAILGHASTRELLPSIAGLVLFAAILLPISFAIFSWALRRTKITGTLTHF